MEEHKFETRLTYDLHADKFEDKFREHFEKYTKPVADLFIDGLRGSRVLDIGSGHGFHGQYFKQRGLDVKCIDISPEMVKRCRNKGLDAEVMDAEDIDFPDQSFDGVWAFTSLLHLQRARFPYVVERVHGILKPEGLFGIAMKEGAGEGYERSERLTGTQRHFSYFTEGELRSIYGDFFYESFFSRTKVKKSIFLTSLLRKNPSL